MNPASRQPTLQTAGDPTDGRALTRRWVRAWTVLLLAGPTPLVLASCDSSAPADRMIVLLSAEPMLAMLGDTIHLVGVAHNPTDF